MQFSRRLAALVGVTALAFAACTGGGTPAPTTGGTSAPTDAPPPSAAAPCVVGVSWNNFNEERWGKFDEPALKAAIEAGGGTYISNDAKSSAETQASNVENLITQGANVLVILAQDGTAIKPSVASATAQGVPVAGDGKDRHRRRIVQVPPTAQLDLVDQRLLGSGDVGHRFPESGRAGPGPRSRSSTRTWCGAGACGTARTGDQSAGRCRRHP